MAVTTEYSTEVANVQATPLVMQEASKYHGKLRVMSVTFTQSAAAGDIGSIVYLAKLPAGKVQLLGFLCAIKREALGASRTMSTGYDAYIPRAGGTAVAASDNALDSAIDYSAAGTATLCTAKTNLTHEFDSRDGVMLRFKVAGGTIPATTKMQGFIVYSVE